MPGLFNPNSSFPLRQFVNRLTKSGREPVFLFLNCLILSHYLTTSWRRPEGSANGNLHKSLLPSSLPGVTWVSTTQQWQVLFVNLFWKNCRWIHWNKNNFFTLDTNNWITLVLICWSHSVSPSGENIISMIVSSLQAVS